MATKSQKIRIGVFTVVAAGLIAVVLIVFGGLRFWETKDHYRIVFDDTVMGLESGGLVYINGMRVGAVDSVEVLPEDIRKTVVGITVKHGTPVRADTQALLSMAGITGLKVIDLRSGSLTSPQLAEGAVIPVGATTLDKLTNQAERIAEQSGELMKRANRIVDNLVTLTDPKRFAGIDELLAQAGATAQAAHSVADNLASASGTIKVMVNENRVALHDSITSMQATAKTASEMLGGQVGQLVGNASEFVSQLKGLVHNNEGEIRSAVFDLRQASRSFKELARDVRQRPSRLLFSDTPAERKLP